MRSIFPLSRLFTATVALVSCLACAATDVTMPDAAARAGAAVTVQATGSGPQACRPDSKLIGRIELATRDEPGTWWHLTRTGLDAAGITDYLGAINAQFGASFADLGSAVPAVIDAVRALDANQNGFVCAYTIQGTLAYIGDPNFSLYTFAVRDDKHAGP